MPPASADAIIACDLVVAASGDALGLMDAGRTVASANADVTPTSEFIRDRSKTFESQMLASRVKRQTRDFASIDAEALAIAYLNDAIYTNMIMVGYAWQKGHVPVSLRGLYRAIKMNGVKVEENMKAFDVGRLAAADPERLEKPSDPRGDVRPMTLDDLIEDRAARLVAYQNEAYAQSYRDVVAHVRAREDRAGLGEGLATAVARYAFKLMAYKDEYEVARLYTDGSFEKKLRETFHGGKVQYHMAPPLLSRKDADGHLMKKPFGPWMKTAFKLMKQFKGLRGTRLDPFGYTAERRMERELRDEYLASMGTLADGLTKKNHELAIAIASIPDDIRGYGHVKDASVEAAKAREAELWQNWPAGGLPAKKQTLIAAE